MTDVKQEWGTCATCPHFAKDLDECRFIQPPWHTVKPVDWCSRHPDRQIAIQERLQEVMVARAKEQQRQGPSLIIPKRGN